MHCLIEIHRSGRIDGDELDVRGVDSAVGMPIAGIVGLALRRTAERVRQRKLRPNRPEVDSLHRYSTRGHASSTFDSAHQPNSVVPVVIGPISGFVAFRRDLHSEKKKTPTGSVGVFFVRKAVRQA
jgi:hypothetical protein